MTRPCKTAASRGFPFGATTAQPDRWHLLTQVKNYADAKADVVLKFSVDGQPLGQRKIALAPNELGQCRK